MKAGKDETGTFELHDLSHDTPISILVITAESKEAKEDWISKINAEVNGLQSMKNVLYNPTDFQS